MPPRIQPRLREFAESMRRAPTPFERTLWRELGASRLDGLKFRRQSVIDEAIVDFYCPMAALVVEIDGGTHDRARDALRDARLAEHGLKVLRFANQQVAENLDGILRAIMAEARPRRTDRHNPSSSQRAGFGNAQLSISALAIDSPTPDPSLEREGSRKC